LEFASRGRRDIFPIVSCRRCRARLCIGRRIGQGQARMQAAVGLYGALWRRLFNDTKTRGAAERCRRQIPKETLRLQKSGARNRGNDLSRAQWPPGLSSVGGGVNVLLSRNENRTCCYPFATQLGSKARHPTTPNGRSERNYQTKQDRAEQVMTG
jgi:hypothetical protein